MRGWRRLSAGVGGLLEREERCSVASTRRAGKGERRGGEVGITTSASASASLLCRGRGPGCDSSRVER